MSDTTNVELASQITQNAQTVHLELRALEEAIRSARETMEAGMLPATTVRVRWGGGGSAAGDPLPVRNLEWVAAS